MTRTYTLSKYTLSTVITFSKIIPFIPFSHFVIYQLQDQFIKIKKKKKKRKKTNQTQKRLSSRYTNICFFFCLQFFKNNCLKVLVDNICSQKQVKNQ